MAKYLLANGANPHIEDLTSKDSCDYAQIGDVKALPELLVCRGLRLTNNRSE